jgi:hypothetical protein
MALGVGLILAGVVVWRQMSALPYCPPGVPCPLMPLMPPPHRLHPVRAEALWAAGVLCLGVGAYWAARVSRRGFTDPAEA